MDTSEIQMTEDLNQSSPRLRIAYLLQQFPVPTETFAVSDIASLLARGHDVTVYTMKLPRRRQRMIREASGVPANLVVLGPSLTGVISWPGIMLRWRRELAWLFRRVISNWRSEPITCIQALLCIPRLAEIADNLVHQDCDVVHAFWSRHVGLVLPLLRRNHSRALRTAFVGAYDLVADDFLLELTAEAAEVLFSHAEVNRTYLQARAATGTSIAIIHRGIPLVELPPDDSRDPFRLITASALVQSKNVEAVIRAFAAAHARENRLRLDVYGDGPERPRLEKLAEDLNCSAAVSFKGHIRREELFARMNGASVFLMLSKKASERLPNVIKEALWAGCAVISSRSEGIEELIPAASIGKVVDADDLQAVAAALLAFLGETPAQSSARRRKAREFIGANFSSDASMRRYVEAWRNKAQFGNEARQPGRTDGEGVNSSQAGI